MKKMCMEIMFALYMNDGRLSLEWLSEFLSDGAGGAEDIAQLLRECLGALTSAGLVRLSLTGGLVYVSLTDKGAEAALVIADTISDRMMEQWQQTHSAPASEAAADGQAEGGEGRWRKRPA